MFLLIQTIWELLRQDTISINKKFHDEKRPKLPKTAKISDREIVDPKSLVTIWGSDRGVAIPKNQL